MNSTVEKKTQSKLKYYWSRTEYDMFWTIGLRKRRCGKTILSNTTDSFSVLDLPEKTFAADPFLFEYNNKTYLFFELFLYKKNKGVIAYAEIIDNVVGEFKIAIEEDFHLSFPCIFKAGNDIYMIPETGAEKKIILYKCETFPDKWRQEKILLEDVDSSDNIVFDQDGKLFLIASILKDHTCIASNTLYEFDPNEKSLRLIEEKSEFGNIGFRNAGLLFEDDDRLIRPGQNCEGNQYGKGLVFWNVDEIDDRRYKESIYKNIFIDDIAIDSYKNFCGVHTYNLCRGYETIDLKILKKNSFFKRLYMLSIISLKFFMRKIKGLFKGINK